MLMAISILVLFLCMLIIITRALSGPSIYDRVLAVNMFGTKTVLIISLGGYMLGWTSFADVALLYALINFIGTIAVLRFVEATVNGEEENQEDNSI
tara:strand:- start:74616 stop:74903 length:288 start_codon:yes stop_codon:yes gene_type:complete